MVFLPLGHNEIAPVAGAHLRHCRPCREEKLPFFFLAGMKSSGYIAFMSKNDPNNRAHQNDVKALIDLLGKLQSRLEHDLSDVANIPIRKRKELRDIISKIQSSLSALFQTLDVISQPPIVLDPSDPSTVGTLIAHALLEQEKVPLRDIGRFYGSGVYAIYYSGDFPVYQPIVGSETPIYVGKADPAIHGAETPEDQGDRLSRRLRDHQRSIRNAKNLHLEDLFCRYLVVKSAWQSTAETYLIDKFKPVWNIEVGICYGFGKHGDSSSTRKNTRSPWDTLHPGRTWAMTKDTVPNEQTIDEICQKIYRHFKDNPPTKGIS